MHKTTFLSGLLVLIGTSLWAQPRARFSMPETSKVYEGVSFINETKNASRLEWDFGDGQTSTEVTPTHKYMASGKYTVRLTAFDERNRSRSSTKTIRISPPDRCLVHMQTPMGSMVLQLYDVTSAHQDNFVKLAEQHFYDSLLFHRVIQGFMIQGGDPFSRTREPGQVVGTGGPGYTIKAEFADSLAHIKGALAAARTSNPQKRSSGSQFYIVQGRSVTADELNRIEAQKNFRYPRAVREAYLANGGTPALDQDYTVFGRVIDGLDVIDRIAAVRTNSDNFPQEDMWMIVRVMR